MCDQLVEVAVHAQQFHDCNAAAITLEVAALAAGGAVQHRFGIFAARAEQVYGELDPEQQLATRRLFARLVTPGDDAPDTRRRSRRSELPAAVLEVVDDIGERAIADGEAVNGH